MTLTVCPPGCIHAGDSRKLELTSIAFNAAANGVMAKLETSDVYGAVMDVCPPTSGDPDHTYSSCKLQSPGGVHFRSTRQ
jgi:hypothetical protein